MSKATEIIKNKSGGGKKAFFDLNVLNTKEGSVSTYVVLTAVVAVPTSLKNRFTKRQLFDYLKSRGLVAENGEFTESHYPVKVE